MTTWPSALLIAGLGLWPASAARAQTATFDFDTGTPVLSVAQNIPFDQTSGGITAHFSSRTPGAPAFSVQSDATTHWTMPQFSGRYLYDNDLDRSVLAIQFSRTLTSISLTFATADFEIEVPSTIQLTAYLDSNQAPPVGAASTHGAYPVPRSAATMPSGTLAFNSGAAFNLVEIVVPYQLGGATTFFVDNITVTASASSATIATVSAASFAPGAVAAGSIATGFGRGLASATAGPSPQPLPTTLANTTVMVKDSAGGERPGLLYYVSPSQINYVVPELSAPGPATVTVTSEGQVTATGTLFIDAVAPGIFTANQDGRGAPAAEAIRVAPDRTHTVHPVAVCGAAPGSCVTVPVDLGPAGTQVFLTLYGTGFRARSSLAAVAAKIGAAGAVVDYAGAQSQYAGMDQVNVLIPAALAGQGEVDVTLTVGGKAANTIRIHIQ